MTTKRNRLPNAAFGIIIFGLLLGSYGPGSRGQTGISAPVGYLPGWWVNVQKAGSDPANPVGERLAGFAAPAAGFDMASYRDQTPTRFDFGLSYDATGALNATQAGAHQLAADVSWGDDPDAVEAHCALSIMLDGRPVANWRGTVGATADHGLATGDADLQPGLHPAEVRVACDQAVGARVAVALSLKAPSDSGPRPLSPAEIIHPGETRPSVAITAPAAPAPGPTPPAPAETAPSVAEAAPAATIMVATIDLGIHQYPDRKSRRLGRLVYGQEVRVLGPLSDPAWVELADGGFVESGFLKPPGAAAPPRPGATQRRPR